MLALVLALQLAAADIAVIDGDTVDVGEVRYRVAGLDAPEIQNARCLAERRLGQVAKARAEQLLAGAATIELEETGRVQPATERYRERREARLLIDGADLAALLIGEGLAQAPGRRRWCNGL
ncbi:MAG: hypothetical protein BroJett013_30400 [Alphaproteobacteria bacterium]|nr:MAG: hypothetical protein BroJett013_30400 [Alphaproteobacteria bacterium]